MRTHLSPLRQAIAIAAAAALFVAGCGGDDDDATPQDQLTNTIVDSFGTIEGLEIDEDCIASKVDELTDEQVTAMTDAVENNTDAPADLAAWSSSLGDECLSAG